MQDLGSPIKINGSGYVLIDGMNLDSQMLIVVDKSTLQGLLTLKATDVSIMLLIEIMWEQRETYIENYYFNTKENQ